MACKKWILFVLVFCETHFSHELGECCRFYLLHKYYIILILWASSVSIFNCFNYRKVDHQFIYLMFLLRRRKIMMGLDMQKVLFKWTFFTCTKIFTWQSMYFQFACFYDGLKNSLMRWQVVTHFFIYPSQLVISANCKSMYDAVVFSFFVDDLWLVGRWWLVMTCD